MTEMMDGEVVVTPEPTRLPFEEWNGLLGGYCEVPTRLVRPGARLPVRSYPDDAGVDLVVSETTVLPPGTFTDIPNDIEIALPSECWGLVTGRSSTLRKRGVMVVQGVIDAGYRGPMFSGCWNLTQQSVVVERGERIAQLILVPVVFAQFIGVDELPSGTRGDAGFGSTGR